MSQFVPILSIVIPTRNRFDYAISSISSIVSIPSQEIELVVQDSSDSDKLGLWISEYVRDERLRYNYAAPPVSMTENFNKAVQMASGEYICIIGDDDGVNPEIVAATKWAKANNLDALTPVGSVSYGWPDFQSRYYGMGYAGKLLINKFSGTKLYPDIEAEMRKCVLSAGQDKFALPKVYFGIVRRQCMVEVRKQSGAFFAGVSPDVFGALSVANYAKKVCIVDYPLIIPGSSGASNSGRSAMGKHKGRLENEPHMQAFHNLKWPDLVPKFFSVETVWAEAAVEALQATGRTDLLRQFNFPFLHALCIFYHPDFYSVTMRNFYCSLRLTNRGYMRGTVQFVYAMLIVIWRLAKRIGFRLLHPKPGAAALEFRGLNNIEEAVQALSLQLKSSGRSFEECV